MLSSTAVYTILHSHWNAHVYSNFSYPHQHFLFLDVCLLAFDNSHPGGKGFSHFNLCFYVECFLKHKRCQVSFHVLIGHLYIFVAGITRVCYHTWMSCSLVREKSLTKFITKDRQSSRDVMDNGQSASNRKCESLCTVLG